MDNLNDSVAKPLQAAAGKAAERASDKVDELRSSAAPVLSKAASRTRDMGKQGLDAVNDAAAWTTDSIIAYTKENPMKALLIAAASGALIVGLVKALQDRRE